MGLESLSHQPALGPGGKLGDDGVLKRVSQKSFWLPMCFYVYCHWKLCMFCSPRSLEICNLNLQEAVSIMKPKLIHGNNSQQLIWSSLQRLYSSHVLQLPPALMSWLYFYVCSPLVCKRIPDISCASAFVIRKDPPCIQRKNKSPFRNACECHVDLTTWKPRVTPEIVG